MMPHRPPVLKPNRPKLRKLDNGRSYDKNRPNAYRRGYTREWQKASKAFLAKNPLCVKCLEDNRLTPSTTTDHIIPHDGNYELFWDRNNWQAMCKTCHDRKTATEDGGFGNERKCSRKSKLSSSESET